MRKLTFITWMNESGLSNYYEELDKRKEYHLKGEPNVRANSNSFHNSNSLRKLRTSPRRKEAKR